ncbi:MAG: AAA family ATPase [Candidatus Aminicenantes bacterium]|nr:AAA family ATPase [Candidatus Aminicenantes bacterium]NIM82157.1 AAA family ATPase [Candidatus Aminicenantes bacterium]NIN21558.1 AAA family ATPase [Candidatus Aminicenantes bacterium]NIN45367.1 AAA family ATPase [Candidatus Aminicenantes bacterium]NIN88188.1 AAA family ATPase [Candidatus Aminicenantes bacterium]
MRRFSSYGPVNTKLHYYAPRKELIERAYTQLIGETPGEGGHYITVWAPRQTGKTWLMQQILFRLQEDARFDVLKINLEILKDVEDAAMVMDSIAKAIGAGLGKNFTAIDTREKFQGVFKKEVLAKPLILILDEFDALEENVINTVVSAFRNIYISRMDEVGKPTEQKTYLLHAVALIGVRSVLGIENPKGSPFNVQRSVHIPNLTFEEVRGIFQWYEKEGGQKVQSAVIENVYRETNGQPGLTCWLGELLTEGFEGYANDKSQPITLDNFEEVLAAAINILPNNNILNIISKANEPEHKIVVLDLFKTDQKVEFTYDDKSLNFLYMNGVIDREKETRTRYYVKFASPFVQKRLFNYFSRELFRYMGKLYDSFDDPYDDIITETHLDIRNLLRRYETYLKKNREWLLKDAPHRADLRIFEAVYHFNLFSYLKQFLGAEGGSVNPEFPTGNGKVDLIITYAGQQYGIEVKSFTTRGNYRHSLEQAAKYGKQLGLAEIFLVFFVDAIDKENRGKYEKDYLDEAAGITVVPIFVETG